MYRNTLKYFLSIPSPDVCVSHIELYEKNNTTQLCQCIFDIDLFHAMVAPSLGVVIPKSISNSVKKRQAEFIAGRYMAKICLKQMNSKEHNLEIGRHREPIWPVGFLGTISHANNKAVALVSTSTSYNYVGIDIENFLNPTIASKLAGSIHSQDEKALFCKYGFSDHIATSIIFSAKESLFKATFPYIRKYFGFECARVIEINTIECSLTLDIDITLSRYCSNKKTFNCQYFLEDNYVVTIILN